MATRKRQHSADPETVLDRETDRMATIDDFKPATAAKLGVGYLPDEPDPRDWLAGELFGAMVGALPGAASLEGFVRSVRDQGGTNSCVGQAIALACDVRLARMGHTAAEPTSALACYGFARSLARLSPDQALRDSGSYPRLAMKGLREFGLPPERRWPFDASKVNAELPWDVHQAASSFRVAAWYRIDSWGAGRISDVCRALALGFPVVFGTGVDYAFLSHTGPGVVGAPKGNIIGGHMMAIVGYRTTSTGARELRVANSWGTDWGDRGFFWASADFFDAPNAGDFYVIQVG